jgi:hypothetical protein
MPVLPKTKLPKCDSCEKWNSKAMPNRRSSKGKYVDNYVQSIRPFEHLQIDIGHMPSPDWLGRQYFQVVGDVASRKAWLQVLSRRSYGFDAFAWLYRRLKVEKPHAKLKSLRGDGEYGGRQWLGLAREEGFILNIASPHSGKAFIAERDIGLLRRICMPQLDYCGANMLDWSHSMQHGVTLFNDQHTVSLLKGMTRNMAWEMEYVSGSETPPLKLRVPRQVKHVFGMLCYLKIFLNNKAQMASEPATWLGERDEYPGKHVVRVLRTGRVVVSKSVHGFDCTVFPAKSPQYYKDTMLLRAPSKEVAPLGERTRWLALPPNISLPGRTMNCRPPTFSQPTR